MDQKPLIGVTTYGRNENDDYTIPANYVEAVRRAGGIPCLIPPGCNGVAEILTSIQGLVLTGGGDINPTLYGGQQHETLYKLDAKRDASELEICNWVIAAGLPTLAICRGAQMINIAAGGTLHEHLPDVVGESVLHRAPPREPILHTIQVEPNTRLAKIMGQQEFSCFSWHHQSIRNLAPNLIVSAYAPDGVVEAIELPDHPWLVGIQWHPEISAKEEPLQQLLFEELVVYSSQ